MKPTPYYFCFDVESLGLHGVAFAAAFVVINHSGDTLEEQIISCDPKGISGDNEDKEWCSKNIPELPITHEDEEGVRYAFWQKWMSWKANGAVMIADCAWPVEARFLMHCVEDDFKKRKWNGPYPLHDLASIRLAKGEDPMACYERKPDELPQHNPLCDARQTARNFAELVLTNE